VFISVAAFSREIFFAAILIVSQSMHSAHPRAALEELAGFFVPIHVVQSFDEGFVYWPILVVKEGGKAHSLTSLTRR
jgi:hypothetical protein